jgi:hypothetical protein
VEEEEGTPQGGVLPFIGGRDGWKRAAQVVAGGGGETGGMVERRPPRSDRAWHGRRRYSDSVADKRGPHSFVFFLNYPNWLKLGN